MKDMEPRMNQVKYKDDLEGHCASLVALYTSWELRAEVRCTHTRASRPLSSTDRDINGTSYAFTDFH